MKGRILGLRGLLFPVLLLSAFRPVMADMVFLRDGRILVGRVSAQTLTTVDFSSETGKETFRKGSILRIQFGDPGLQKEELRQRLAREEELRKRRAEAIRLAEERQKAAEEAVAREKLRKEAELAATQAAEEEARQKAQQEAQRLKEEQKKADAEEARRLADERAAQESANLLQEQTEVRTRRLTVRSGGYSMESGVLRNASRLPYVGDMNQLIRGGVSLTGVSDPGRIAIPFGAYRELVYESHNHRSQTGWVQRMSYLDSRGTSYVAFQDASAQPSVFNTSTSNYSRYSTRTETQEWQSPRLREFNYSGNWKVYPLRTKFLENLHFVLGLGLSASYAQADGGWMHSERSGDDLHGANVLYASNGTTDSLAKNRYGEGIGFGNFGIGYSLPFYDIHSWDFRVIASGGSGYGYLNHEERSLATVASQTVVAEAHARGRTEVRARRLEAETGYAVDIYGARLRLFAQLRQSHLSVVAANIKTGNAAEKMTALAVLAQGQTPDYTPFLLERLGNPGPFPDARDVLRGVGIEAGLSF